MVGIRTFVPAVHGRLSRCTTIAFAEKTHHEPIFSPVRRLPAMTRFDPGTSGYGIGRQGQVDVS